MLTEGRTDIRTRDTFMSDLSKPYESFCTLPVSGI